MTKHRLCWQNKKDGKVGYGDWRDTAEHVTRIARCANEANGGGGMLLYWVQSKEIS